MPANLMTQRNSCPICTSSQFYKFLIRENVPVHQNLLYSDEKSAVNAKRGNLELVVCNDCGFVFNQTFDLSKLSYGEKYDNTQDISPYFDRYLNNLANHLIKDKKIQNSTIVEIGCGKGTFLRKLVEKEELGNLGYGFDPSYMGPEKDLKGRLIFEKRYYDINCTEIDANVIISRHVIEHIPDPLNLLQLVRKTLPHSKNAQVFFETPSVDWILQNQVLYDFFYEHCSYFSPNSLRTAFVNSGFRVEHVQTIFEDQYLWIEATLEEKEVKNTSENGLTPSLARKFGSNEDIIKKNWIRKIEELTSKGKTAIWGAGAKGVTFVNLIDPECKLIDCVIDLNNKKQGKFIAGTGHPIVNYKDIQSREIKSVVLMNPNYFDETSQLIEKSNLDINLIQS